MSNDQRVPIGVTSMCFWNMKVEEAIPRACDMGYDAMEIWVEHLAKFGEGSSRIAQMLSHKKLRRTVHSPIMDINITSPNAGIRAESLRQILQSIELTHDLGAELIIIHPGRLHSTKDSIEAYWEMVINSFERIIAHADKHNVNVAVENMDVQNDIEVVKWTDDIHRITKHFAGKLGVVMDTTHLSNDEQILQYIKDTNHIVHTHLSDARVMAIGIVDTHLPLGEGELNFPKVFDALLPQFHGIVSLETFIPPGNPKTILAQREWLDGILNS